MYIHQANKKKLVSYTLKAERGSWIPLAAHFTSDDSSLLSGTLLFQRAKIFLFLPVFATSKISIMSFHSFPASRRLSGGYLYSPFSIRGGGFLYFFFSLQRGVIDLLVLWSWVLVFLGHPIDISLLVHRGLYGKKNPLLSIFWSSSFFLVLLLLFPFGRFRSKGW